MLEAEPNDPRKPAGYVVHIPALGAEVYGPFMTDDEAWLWASRNAPERVLLTVLPVYATLRA